MPAKDFTHKASIMVFHEHKSEHLADAASEWLDKWEGQYRDVNPNGPLEVDFIYDMDIVCTGEAYDDLPDDIQCDSEWTRGEITEDELVYGREPRSKHRERQIRNIKKEAKR